ncbi:hypothetical protein GCM10027610_019570 [Dactylosporangium cerinum]
MSGTAAVAAAAVLAITLNPVPASAATVPTAVFTQDSTWPSGNSGHYTVTNGGATALPNWRVEFDLPAGTTISHYWNATITHSGTHYVALGASWNASLAPGASTSFGWVAAGTGTPQRCLLNAAPCDGLPSTRDVRPPTTPPRCAAPPRPAATPSAGTRPPTTAPSPATRSTATPAVPRWPPSPR